MSESRIGILVEAQDLASAKIEDLWRRMTTLESTMLRLNSTSGVVAGTINASLAAFRAEENQLERNIKTAERLRANLQALHATQAQTAAGARLLHGAHVAQQSTMAAIAQHTGLGAAPAFTAAQIRIMQAMSATPVGIPPIPAAAYRTASQQIGGVTTALAGATVATHQHAQATTHATAQTNAMTAAMGRTAASAHSGTTAIRLLRHGFSEFDEQMRGQRGAMIATLGATLRDLGLSAGALTAAAGGLAVVMAAPAIVRGAENMGKWAVATRAGATAAAMSITHFSQLQGALEVSGKKADSADGNLRRFARTVGEAIADPASKSAQALHNFGLTQAEIVEHSQDVFPLLVKMADGFREYGTGATTAQNATKAFGQGWENIAAVLTGGGQNLLDLMNKAKDLGGTLTDETEPGVEATGRAAEELGKSVKREATQAFIEWAPTIEKIINLLGWLGHAINKTVSAIHSLATTIATMPLTGEWAYIPPVPDDLKDAAKKLGAGVPSDVTLETTVTAARRKSMAPLGGAKELSEQAAAARAHMQLMVAEARHNAGAIAAAYDEYIGKLKSIYGEGSRQVEAAEAQKLRAVESAENRGAAAAKRATREAFAEYSAKEREKVAAAEGNFAEITAIYNEWLAHTKAVWGEHSKEYQTVLREMVEATNRFKLEAVRAMREVGEAQLRSARLDFEFKMETESGMAPQVRRHTEAQQALEEAQKIGTAALEQIRVLESVAKSANASAKTQEEAQHEILMISNDAKEKIIADMRTWADYAKAEATKLAKLFEGVFDRLGGQFESFSDSLVKALLAPQRELYRAGFTTIQESMRGNEIRTAMRSLLLGAINDVMKSIETGLTSLLARTLSGGVYDTMSQVLGNALSKVVGNLFGGAAGGAVGGIFGGAAGSAPTVAAITAQTTALTTAIASSTAAIVSAVQAAAIVEAATPKPLGFAAGGIVPSAQGGMVVGGATLSLLHPREMVLPAHISEGLQRMIGGAGGGGVNYSPTINTGPTTLDRGAFASMLAAHSGSIVGDVRNLMRSGWRPR